MLLQNADNLDRVLDELDELARSKMPTSQFFALLTERVRLTMDTDAAAVLMPVAGRGVSAAYSKAEHSGAPETADLAGVRDWISLATSGSNCDFLPEQLSQSLSAFVRYARQDAVVGPAERNEAGGWIADSVFAKSPFVGLDSIPGLTDCDLLAGRHEGRFWIAVPLRPKRFSAGCLVVCTEVEIPPATHASFIELLAAFAEIADSRINLERELFLDDSWERIQSLSWLLPNTNTLDEAATLVVATLAKSLKAARVSIFCKKSGATQVRAISGMPWINVRSAVVQRLQQLASETSQIREPIVHRQAYTKAADGRTIPHIDEQGVFENRIGIQLPKAPSIRATHLGTDTAIIFEFENYAQLVSSAARLAQVLPLVAATWFQHQRWLGIPAAVRGLTGRQAILPALSRSLARWLVVLSLLGVACWALRLPIPLVVEAPGAYEPARSRTIYATADGFVEELLVQDGERVEARQALLRLRSPNLDLQIEQVEGESRSIEEEENGLRIAINQIDVESSEAVLDQSRLAAKIAELKIRRESLQVELRLLQAEYSRLVLVAPLAGTVVGKDLQQQLMHRPVRRGDPLFIVVDDHGPWRVRLQVAERDTGYIFEHYAAPNTHQDAFAEVADGPERLLIDEQAQSGFNGPSQSIEFVFDSLPNERFQARLDWISDQVENRFGEGCILEIRATTQSLIPKGVHAGAGVTAFFECGQQPLWFVWCRPIVEAVQRRMWFQIPAAGEKNASDLHAFAIGPSQ